MRQRALVWEVLMEQLLLGAAALDFPDPLAVLKANQFLRVLEQEGQSLELATTLARAEVVLPETIFPLPQLPVSESSTEMPEPDPALTATLQRRETLLSAVQELRDQQEVQLEVARATPAPPVPPSLALATEGQEPAPDQVAAIAEAQQQWADWGHPASSRRYRYQAKTFRKLPGNS